MNHIKELADEIYAVRLQRARERRPMLKLLDGFELFNEARRNHGVSAAKQEHSEFQELSITS